MKLIGSSSFNALVYFNSSVAMPTSEGKRSKVVLVKLFFEASDEPGLSEHRFHGISRPLVSRGNRAGARSESLCFCL